MSNPCSKFPPVRLGAPIDLKRDSATLRNKPPGTQHQRLLTDPEREILGCPPGSELLGIAVNKSDIVWGIVVPCDKMDQVTAKFRAQIASPFVVLRDDARGYYPPVGPSPR